MHTMKSCFFIEQPLDGPALLRSIERYGRVCYKSEDKMTDESAARFVRMLIKSGHESVLEHEKITVRFIVDRGVTHEIVRHRIASYSQESTRYCDYGSDKFGKQIAVIAPCFFPETPREATYVLSVGPKGVTDREPLPQDRFGTWWTAMMVAEWAYLRLLEQGASPQEARTVLPNSLKSEIIVSQNCRQWRHFFKLRTSPKAHPQMREVTIPLLKHLNEQIPVIFEDLVPATEAGK